MKHAWYKVICSEIFFCDLSTLQWPRINSTYTSCHGDLILYQFLHLTHFLLCLKVCFTGHVWDLWPTSSWQYWLGSVQTSVSDNVVHIIHTYKVKWQFICARLTCNICQHFANNGNIIMQRVTNVHVHS